jgi:hypothetical protein
MFLLVSQRRSFYFFQPLKLQHTFSQLIETFKIKHAFVHTFKYIFTLENVGSTCFLSDCFEINLSVENERTISKYIESRFSFKWLDNPCQFTVILVEMAALSINIDLTNINDDKLLIILIFDFD